MNKPHPTVAILIPTYNQAAWIRRAVDSALIQTYPNKTILVLDDASPDHTEQALADLITSKQIHYLRNRENTGRVANYRRGLESASHADWVINLDGDDFFTNPTFIQEAMERIQSIGEASVLFFQGVNLYGKNEATSCPIEPNIAKPEITMPASEYILGYFDRNAFSHLATLYPRNLALSVGFYQHNILSTDVDSILRLCLAYPNQQVIVSKLVAGLWAQHPGNASKLATTKELQQNFTLYKRVIQQMGALGWPRLRIAKWVLQAYWHWGRSILGTRIRQVRINTKPQ